MNKKQIIKILEKEIGFLDITEDENSLGELYITEAKFKQLRSMIAELKEMRDELKKQIKFYKKKILKNEAGTYIHKEINELVKDRTIIIEGDLIMFDNKNLILSSNFLSSRSLI